jgi:hypothetical protein
MAPSGLRPGLHKVASKRVTKKDWEESPPLIIKKEPENLQRTVIFLGVTPGKFIFLENRAREYYGAQVVL